MISTGEDWSVRGSTCPSANSSTSNPTWTRLGSNPRLCGERLAINPLSYGTTEWLTKGTSCASKWRMVYSYCWIAVWGWVGLEQLAAAQLVKMSWLLCNSKFYCIIYEGRPLAPTWARWIQFTSPYAACVRSIFMLSFRLSLFHPIGLFPAGLQLKFLDICLIFCVLLTPFRLLLCDFITKITFFKVENHGSLYYVILSLPVTPSLLDPNALHSTLLLNTLSICVM